MPNFYLTENIKDQALRKVIRHVKARHPHAQPIYHDQFIGSAEGMREAGSVQLFIVAHGTADGRIAAGGTVKPEPAWTAQQLATLLRRKGLPGGIPLRIKLAQCWGGNPTQEGVPHSSFAGGLARALGEMSDLSDEPYADWVSVGGYLTKATWAATRQSRSSGRVSRSAPGWAEDPDRGLGQDPTHMSRTWYGSDGGATEKMKSAAESVFVFFPFDYPST